MRFPRILGFLVALALSASFLCSGTLYAQYGRGMGFDRRRGFGPPRTEEKPADENKEKKEEKPEEKKEDEKKPAEKKDEGPTPVQRPMMPERPADPGELKQMPDAEGLISFSFKGQPWPSVLEWLADISDMSLEWEEAPAGYVDLTTRGRYTVDEVRDLLNSYLLAKGFTVMRNGELLIVVNLKKLDNSLVPRVTMNELDQRGTYEFARAFFDLDWLVAEQAAEEVKSLLSPYGKVTALKATNRLDVLDTAGNLRRIRDLLQEEQSNSGQQRLVEEFKLRFTRAEEVLDTLNTLLGIEPKQAAGPVDPRQLMQAMMMAQQGGGQAAIQPGKKENSVYLAVNARENSILANAPPDKMGVIRQAITAVDVPHGGKGFLADAQRVKVYRLSGLQPETLVKVLKELGSLDPTTKLEVDEKKNALVAYAPLADHLLITQLVERLDGTGRKFEVIQLRTLSAEYVAGSIITLMNGPEKQDDNSRRSRYYSWFDSGSSQQQDTTDKFWVEADIERNRLLLRANDVELAEVKALLVKLGEIPTDQRYGTQTRLIPVSPEEGMLEKFEQIRNMMPNPLDVDIDSSMLRAPRPSAPTDQDDPAAAGQRRARPGEPAPGAGQRSGDGPQRRQRGNRSTQRQGPASRFRFAQDRVELVEAADDPQDQTPASSAAETDAADSKTAPDDSVKQEPEAAKTDASDDDAGMEASQPANADETAEDKAEPAAVDEPAVEEPAMADEPADETPADALRDELTAPFRRRGFARDAQEPPPGAGELPPSAHAPIHIKLRPQGLFISSSDPEALDKLESILNSVMPPRTNYEIFTLKHTYAKDMVTLLKDIFRADMAKESNSRTEVFDMFWNGYRGSSNQQTRATLSRRRPLNFVADPVTNTVLVQGADTSQISEIEDLIQRYDRAEPPNSESVRRTKRVALRYAKAKEVADIVKDVYRDLLSPNDKALIGNQPQQQPNRERNNDGNFFSAMFTYLTDDPTKSEVVPRFKGMLSVGIDERSNGVVISAPQILLTEVLEMIADLDAQAKPTRSVVRVMRVRSPGTAAQVQQALSDKATPAATAPADSNGQTPAPQSGGFRGPSSFGGRSR